MANNQNHIPQVVIDILLVKKIAALAATLASTREIAEETGLSDYIVKKVMARADFKDELKKLSDDSTATAKNILKTELGKMVRKVLAVIEHNLEENNLEAVKVYFKALGIEQEETRTGDTQINVMLPGQPKVVDAQVESPVTVVTPSFVTHEDVPDDSI